MLCEAAQGFFVPPIPHPLSDLLCLYQISFLQDCHVVRNGGLGEMNAGFDIGRAEPVIFANRAASSFFEGLKDLPPAGIGYRV